MIRLVVLLCAALTAAPVQAKVQHYGTSHVTFKRAFAPRANRLTVVDGDTVTYATRPERREKVSWRLYGFDTPELHIACERERAVNARNLLASFIASGRILAYVSRSHDKYGRLLARLSVGGRDAGDYLISQGLAYPYFGGKRKNWCA